VNGATGSCVDEALLFCFLLGSHKSLSLLVFAYFHFCFIIASTFRAVQDMK